MKPSIVSEEAVNVQDWLRGNDLAVGASTQIPDGSNEEGVAGRLYRLCFESLQLLCRDGLISSCGGAVGSASKRKLRNELESLYLWGEAFRDGKLDRALESDEESKRSVLQLLVDVGDLLVNDLWPLVFCQAQHSRYDRNLDDLKELLDQCRLIISHHLAGAAEQNEDSDDEADTIEKETRRNKVDAATSHLGLVIKCLMEWAPVLELDLAHADKLRAKDVHPASVAFRVSDPAQSYVQLVRDRYKNAEHRLVERLGEANWQRHIRVRTEDTDSHAKPENAAVHIIGPAFSVFQPQSLFHDSGIGTSIAAEIEYAASAASESSFVSSIAEDEQYAARVPPLPLEASLGKPFKCDICRQMQFRVKNRVDWKKHVFADLRPYICTFANCKDELSQFSTRTTWADHEFTKHRTNHYWKCPECLVKIDTVSGWERHLLQEHGQRFTTNNLRVARMTAQFTDERRAEDEQCPLCCVTPGKPRKGFVKHLGRHMEEIALTALPRENLDDSEHDFSSVEQDSLEQLEETRVRAQALPPLPPTPEAHIQPIPGIDGTASKITPPQEAPRESSSTAVALETEELRESLHRSQEAPGARPLLKPALKALPALTDLVTDVLTAEGDEYVPIEVDEAGEQKVSPQGHVLEGREFNIRTFYVLNRGVKKFMLGIECARVLGYRDSHLLFNKNRSLYKIIATQAEKDELIHQEILPYSYRSRVIVIVTAKSIFRQFGARVIVDGRRVRDDYWEAKAKKKGFTEEDLACEKRPGGTKAREAMEASSVSGGLNIQNTPSTKTALPPVMMRHFTSLTTNEERKKFLMSMRDRQRQQAANNNMNLMAQQTQGRGPGPQPAPQAQVGNIQNTPATGAQPTPNPDLSGTPQVGRPNQGPQQGASQAAMRLNQVALTDLQTQRMDNVIYPDNILNSAVFPQLPGHIKHWGQLKEWVANNTQSLPPNSLHEVKLLQARHFQLMLADRGKSPANRDQPGNVPPEGPGDQGGTTVKQKGSTREQGRAGKKQ